MFCFLSNFGAFSSFIHPQLYSMLLRVPETAFENYYRFKPFLVSLFVLFWSKHLVLITHFYRTLLGKTGFWTLTEKLKENNGLMSLLFHMILLTVSLWIFFIVKQYNNNSRWEKNPCPPTVPSPNMPTVFFFFFYYYFIFDSLLF